MHRLEIDGLRAIAIILVIAFHFGFSIIPGGFIGVDIFFVLSGYLITQVISEQLDRGDFKFKSFFIKRLRRLMPAAVFMMVSLYILLLLVAFPGDLIKYVDSMAYSILGLANIYFFSFSGYFDPLAEKNFLLHMWSLGVEEQFYVFLPYFMYLIYKNKFDNKRKYYIIIAAISFGLCMVVQYYYPVAVFYLAPFRAWELLLGSITYYYLKNKNEQHLQKFRYCGIFSILVLLLCAGFYKPGVDYPGWRAFIVVLSTCILLIHYQLKKGVVFNVSRSPVFVEIGKLSYSLYLWHWPIAALYFYIYSGEKSNFHSIGLVLVTYLIAKFSYVYVENPIRNKNILRNDGKFLKTMLAVVLLFSIILVATKISSGFELRYDKKIISIDAELYSFYKYLKCDGVGLIEREINDVCILGDTDAKSIDLILWGDSHAHSLAVGFDNFLKSEKLSGAVIFSSNCPPLGADNSYKKSKCSSYNKSANEFIKKNPDAKVILAASWPKYYPDANQYIWSQSKDYSFSNSLNTVLDELNSRKIYVIAPIPAAPLDFPQDVIRANIEKRKSPSFYLNNMYKKNDNIMKNSLPNVVNIIYPSNYLCEKESCSVIVDEYPIYRDSGHLNARGSDFLVKKMVATIYEK